MTSSVSVATAKTVRSTSWTTEETTWPQLVERFHGLRRTAETCAQYDAMGKQERSDAKDGPCFVGGRLKARRRAKGEVVARSLLTLDADESDDGIAELWEMATGAAAAIWPTHSSRPGKPRHRIVSPLSRECTPAEYAVVAKAVMAKVDGVTFDDGSAQAERAMYLPSASADAEWGLTVLGGDPIDVDAWLEEAAPEVVAESRADAPPLPTARLGDPREKPGDIGAFCRAYTVPKAIARFLPHVYEEAGADRWTYRHAEAAAGLVVYDDGLWAYSNHETDPAHDGHAKNAYDLVRAHLGDAAVSGICASDPAVASQMFEAEGEPLALKLAGNGQVMQTAVNALTVIESTPKLARSVRYDVSAACLCAVGDLPWRKVDGYSRWTDADDSALRALMDDGYRVRKAQAVSDALNIWGMGHTYDRIAERVAALPEWDGTERLDSYLVDALGADDTPYVRAATRKAICAMIRRAVRPGCKFDHMVILEGPQGIGKSRLLRALGGDLYTDALTIADMGETKRTAEKVEGMWVVEIAELDGIQKASIERLKATTSTLDDRHRQAYGRHVVSRPRRCVLWGTTNNVSGYLRDVTGNRRFWPVHCASKADETCMRQWYVDQVLAEAVEAEPRERLWMDTDELARAAEGAQREAMEEDASEGVVRAYLETPIPDGFHLWEEHRRQAFYDSEVHEGMRLTARGEVSVIEVWREAYGRDGFPTRMDSYQIKGVLSKLGWVVTRNAVRFKAYGVQKVSRRSDV